MSALGVASVLIGGFLVLLFAGYLILAVTEKRRGRAGVSPRRIAGTGAFLLGVVMLGFWSYFMIHGRESLTRSFGELVAHVGLELASSLSLVAAGVAMVLGWPRGPALLMTSIGLLIFSTTVALLEYGSSGHPFLMNGITIVAVVAFAYLLGVAYAWEHFVLRLDVSEEPKDKKDAA